MRVTASGLGLLGVVAGLMGCDEGEPPECEVQDVPTCSSTLVIDRADDSSSSFVVTIKAEDEGLDLLIRCPTPKADDPSSGDITWFCGAGKITLERTGEWPATLEVAFGGGFPAEFTPDYSPGVDRCGNLCNDGTIEL